MYKQYTQLESLCGSVVLHVYEDCSVGMPSSSFGGTNKAVYQHAPVTFWSRVLINAFAFHFLLGILQSLGCSSDFQLCLCDRRKIATDQKSQ